MFSAGSSSYVMKMNPGYDYWTKGEAARGYYLTSDKIGNKYNDDFVAIAQFFGEELDLFTFLGTSGFTQRAGSIRCVKD
jgi:hypothetical protein